MLAWVSVSVEADTRTDAEPFSNQDATTHKIEIKQYNILLKSIL